MIKYETVKDITAGFEDTIYIQPKIRKLIEAYEVFLHQKYLKQLYERSYIGNESLTDTNKKQLILDLAEICLNDESDDFFNYFTGLDLDNMSAKDMFFKVLSHYNILKLAYKLGFVFNKPLTEKELSEAKIKRYKNILNGK